MNDIKLYNNYIKKNTKSFILFSIIIFLTLIVFIFLKNIHFVLKIILKLGIIIMLCFLLIVNLKNINYIFPKVNDNMKKNLIINYIFILFILFFIFFLFFHLF